MYHTNPSYIKSQLYTQAPNPSLMGRIGDTSKCPNQERICLLF